MNMGACTGMGKGHLPSPGKFEKCYCIKNSISEFSFKLNGLDAIGLGVCNHTLCKLNSLLRPI